ncbi:peptidase inhibitor family I36 protein [Streptomyces sp. NPDC127106]|uniref:peptidase inhibitor family I36 protein n=1 Tax=Streptomyces sp. NPDC127106 TaxID=3345360 RepID=UPI0036286F70
MTNIHKRLAQALASVGGAVALLAGGMATAPTASAVPSECPRSAAHPAEDPALCLFDGRGFEGKMLKFRQYGCKSFPGSIWGGFDDRAESVINRTYHRAVLYSGPDCTGNAITVDPRSASSDLGNSRNQISSLRILR